MPDAIGDRMKSQYEDRTRYFLPRRTYTILRIDGKAFHTYTRGMDKPWDAMVEESMDAGAVALCSEGCGCRFAYGQSDEYSFLLTDFELNTSQAWFDGNVQKICSVAASVFTAAFNETAEKDKTALFDCRVFTIPDAVEVENYFIWRQQDAVRNSIQSLAQANFSPKQLHGVNTGQLQDMLFLQKGINWNDLPTYRKRGRCVVKRQYRHEETMRSRWLVDREIPTFTADRDYLEIPCMPTRAVSATDLVAPPDPPRKPSEYRPAPSRF